VQRRPEVAVWGAPPDRTSRCSLNRYLPGGRSEKLGLPGQDGVVHYNWPASMLSVDWVRQHWGAGRFQANWLVDNEGKLIPVGKSRVVDILGGGARARARENGVPASIGFVPEPSSPAPPAPAAPMPPEVVDMRVRAAEEIASMRIKTQRDLFNEQLDWERTKADERYQRLEERIDEVARARLSYDDDDDGPDEWDWLKDLGRKLAPTLQEVLPELFKRFASSGKVLPR
jgi:hypothetical protein